MVWLVPIALLVLLPATVTAQDTLPGDWRDFPTYKDEVVASRGVVATNHPLASAAGQMILAKGGNAVDAIISAYFALSVVEPAMSSPFGSGFINIYTSDGEAVTLDNYTVAPGEATPHMYELVYPEDETKQAEAGHVTIDEANAVGFRSIGVPGNLKAWLWALKNHGSRRLSLGQILAPAIDYSENGVLLSPAVARTIEERKDRNSRFPGWAAEFLPGGRAPRTGELFRRPGYAVTLKALANAGSASASFDEQLETAGERFYRGDIAQNVVGYVRSEGGILTMQDLAWYWGSGLDDLSEAQGLRLRTPVRGTYRGYEIIAMPPTSSGGTHIVEILNILEGYDLASLGFGTPETLHLMTEAMKVAWADRDAYMGDPDYAGKDPSYEYAPPPVSKLIDPDYAARRRTEIDPKRASRYPPGQFGEETPEPLGAPLAESANTTHATAADSDGNVVSMTQTLNHGFGSGVVIPGAEPGAGMLLNNTMTLFDPDPRPGFERANAIAPRKRQLSSMSPTIVLKNGKPFMALGTPGGTRIYATVLQGIINVIDHGMSIQQAVEAPRIWSMMYGDLNMEEGFPEAVVGPLEEMGHSVRRIRTVAGGMNAVLIDPQTGLIHGGACWRRDGSVVGWSGGDALPMSRPHPQE